MHWQYNKGLSDIAFLPNSTVLKITLISLNTFIFYITLFHTNNTKDNVLYNNQQITAHQILSVFCRLTVTTALHCHIYVRLVVSQIIPQAKLPALLTQLEWSHEQCTRVTVVLCHMMIGVSHVILSTYIINCIHCNHQPFHEIFPTY